jgi:hypothetical protein
MSVAADMSASRTALPPHIRILVVRHLGEALAESWRREYQGLTHERPARVPVAAGRDVRSDEDREHDGTNYHA